MSSFCRSRMKIFSNTSCNDDDDDMELDWILSITLVLGWYMTYIHTYGYIQTYIVSRSRRYGIVAGTVHTGECLQYYMVHNYIVKGLIHWMYTQDWEPSLSKVERKFIIVLMRMKGFLKSIKANKYWYKQMQLLFHSSFCGSRMKIFF